MPTTNTKKTTSSTENKNKSSEMNNQENENLLTQETHDSKENEVLKKQIEELQAQMKMMAQMMTSTSTSDVETKSQKSDENRLIPFVNMTTGTYVLKGTRTYYTMEGQFSKRNFTLREARDIVLNMPKTFSEGNIYIADADFVEENDLSYAYKNILSDTQLKNLLNREPNYVVEVYKNASESQKEIIIRMIEDKKISGQFVDANILVELGKLCGKDLVNMEPMPESKEG